MFKSQSSVPTLPWPDRHLPDELLYSYAARLRALNTLGPTRQALATLFGRSTLIPSADLPSHLDETFVRIGAKIGFADVDDLITASTLYPYYRFFMSDRRWALLRQLALGTDGRGLKTQLGIVANGFGASAKLRSCPGCARLSWGELGRVYWHREHQLPGVLVCATHGVALQEDKNPSTSSNRHELLLAPLPEAQAAAPEKSEQIGHRFAILSSDSLRASSPTPSVDARRRAYLDVLRERGWIRGERQVRWSELERACSAYWRDYQALPFRGRLLQTVAGDRSWLNGLIGRVQRLSHPICHLLLIGLLYESVAKFTDACASRPQEPAKGTERQPPPVLGQQKLLIDAKVSCTQVAKVIGVSVSTVVKRRRRLGIPIADRRKKVDAIKTEQILSRLVQGDPVAIVAKLCAVSPSTVYRSLAESGEAGLRRAGTIEHGRRGVHRTAWERGCAELAGSGVKAVRQRCPAAYAWLYRNDLAWLTGHLPSQACRRVVQARVDWIWRDEQLAAKVYQLAADHASQGQRMPSSARIVATVYNTCGARRNVTRLPHFCAALLAVQRE